MYIVISIGTVPTTKLITTDDWSSDDYEFSTTPLPSYEPPFGSPGINETDVGTKIDPGTAGEH